MFGTRSIGVYLQHIHPHIISKKSTRKYPRTGGNRLAVVFAFGVDLADSEKNDAAQTHKSENKDQSTEFCREAGTQKWDELGESRQGSSIVPSWQRTRTATESCECGFAAANGRASVGTCIF